MQVAFLPFADLTVIDAVHAFFAVTLPFLATVATFVLEDVHVSFSVAGFVFLVTVRVVFLPF